MRSKIIYLLSVLSGLFLSQNNCSAADTATFFPLAGDRAAWQKIIERKKVKTVAEQTIARAEKLVMTDAKVISNWGKDINKITVSCSSGKSGFCKMRFESVR